MPKIAQLKTITDIKSGHLFRSRIRNVNDGNVRVIQLKDVSHKGVLNTELLSKEEIEEHRKIDFLEKSDVLFKSKSAKHVATVVKEDLPNTVATVHYFILRVKNDQVLPDYLAWFLNQPLAQRYFALVAAGTRIPIINKKMLEELEVIIPSMDIQEKVVDIYKLSRKEEELLEELKIKRKILTHALLFESVKKIKEV